MITREKAEEVVENIKKSIEPDEIYLFGSYVSGKTKEHSDLDVCIIKNEIADKHQLLLKAKKSLFNIGVPIDLLLFNKVNFNKRSNIWGSIQYEIFNKGIKVYGR
ncbi:nucleotidyltransferase domain-containing protein [Candidatus Saganbacteria bacterium]|nr:nucleotidyltransferase domain-containing protein [Candidatus Saganbacteria bacterium]